MTDKKDSYQATVNDDKADVKIRDKGIVEITLSGNAKNPVIKIF
mgnify:FL=1